MKPDLRIPFVVAALATAACQGGGFGTGGGGGMPTLPQTDYSAPPNPLQTQAPETAGPQASYVPGVPGAAATPQSKGSGVVKYPITQAQAGFACPDTLDGYMCDLRFNLPPPTPTPSPTPKAHKPTPTPSPTPTPTPLPSGSASPTPSPTPTPPSVSVYAEALPKNAPAMPHMQQNALFSVLPLMMAAITPAADFTLSGRALARFTIPKSQIAGRAFALQLFAQTTNRGQRYYRPLWTFNKATLRDQTLTFSFTAPKYTVSRGTTYAVVLYSDQAYYVSPSPSPTASSGSPDPSDTSTP